MSFMRAVKAFFKALKNPDIEERPTSVQEADVSHLRLLHYLQESGRLVDFFKEDITSFSDAQVGAAVRKIHQDCRQVLEELVTIRPLKEENEGALVHIPKGYDPSEIKIVGRVRGEPPFSGVLIHRGWKAHKRSLPKQVGEQLKVVISPAEVEIK